MYGKKMNFAIVQYISAILAGSEVFMRKSITVRLEENSLNELKRMAKENGISQSKVLEQLIHHKGNKIDIRKEKEFIKKYIELMDIINQFDEGEKNILCKAVEDLLCHS